MKFIVHVHIHNHQSESKLDEILKLSRLTLKNQDKIMATIQELQAKIVELETAVNDEQQEVSNALAALEAKIAELEAIIANGGNATELQAAVDSISTIIEDVKTTIPNLPPPEPTPPNA